MAQQKVADLTIDELRAIIREAVSEQIQKQRHRTALQ